MTAQHYTATFTVAQSPEQVFAAVTNPRAWWSEVIVGATDPDHDRQWEPQSFAPRAFRLD